MNIKYVIVNRTDISQSILDKSEQTNPFTVRKSNDLSRWILKFKEDQIPLQLFTLGYIPKTKEEIIHIIENESDWVVAEI